MDCIKMKNYKLQITNDFSLELPLIKTDGQSYYSFNLLGQGQLNVFIAQLLKERLIKYEIDVIVTIEAKAIALVQELSRMLEMSRYVVIRKSKKSYMTNPIGIKGKTIISGISEYWIDSLDLEYLKGKKVLLFDDVVSTGGTIEAAMNLLSKSFIKPVLIGCALTEGLVRKSLFNIELISCGNFPLPGGHND